jgi:hypothetical protein
MIHSVGDSHCMFTFSGISEVAIHHLGPVTMKRMGTGKIRAQSLAETGLVCESERIVHLDDSLVPDTVRGLRLTPTDVLIVSCGEGDVRCFIKPYLTCKAVPMETYLQDLVNDYLDRVGTLEVNGARIGILSIPPPAPYARAIHPQIAPTGTDGERVLYTRTINGMLSQGCAQRGYLFIDVYSLYADENGMLTTALSDGGVHILDTTRVRNLLTDKGLIS